MYYITKKNHINRNTVPHSQEIGTPDTENGH